MNNKIFNTKVPLLFFFSAPELRPCLADGQMREAPGYSESCHTPALGEDKKVTGKSCGKKNIISVFVSFG